MSLQDLYNKRAALVQKNRELLDQAEGASRDLTAAESKLYDERDAEIGKLGKQVQRQNVQNEHERHEADLDRVIRTAPRPDANPNSQSRRSAPASEGLTFRAADGRSVRALTRDERMADQPGHQPLPDGIRADELDLGRAIRGIVTGNWRGAEAEQRAMGVGTDATGGYIVPDVLSNRIIDASRLQARVVQAGAVTVPMESSTLKLARIDGEPTAAWLAEHASGSASDMALAEVLLTAHTLRAYTKVSVELMEDGINTEAMITESLGAVLGLELDRVALVGSGSGAEPEGIFGQTGVQVIDQGVNGAAITDFDEFSTAVENIATVNGPDANGLSAIYAPRTAGTLDRFKDTANQPLVAPQSFQGLRKFASGQVPINQTKGTETDATFAVVGEFSKLLVGMRSQVSILASPVAGDGTDSAFTDFEVWIRASLRADIALARANRFCVIDGIIP